MAEARTDARNGRDKLRELSTFDGAGASVRLLRALAAHLLSRGVDVPALFAAEGISVAGLFDSNARLPHETFTALWARAEEVTGDPQLGLHALDVADFRLFTIPAEPSEYVMLQLGAASATVGDAIERWARFYRLVDSDAGFTLDRRPNGNLRATFEVTPGLTCPRSYVDYSLGGPVRMLHATTDGRFKPARVTFRRAAPARPADYHRTFLAAAATVDFGAERDAFEIAKRDLGVSLATARPALLPLLERRALDALGEIDTKSVEARVRAAIAAELVVGNPSAEQIAARLQTPVRTLSRRLAAAGTSYRDVLDGVRSQLAHRYVVEEARPVTETATLLGFADPSSFARAFKRWFGRGPSKLGPSKAPSAARAAPRVAEKVARAR